MVLSTEVEEAVDDERLDFTPAAHAEFPGHFICGGEADDDVAKMRERPLFRVGREAQHIRRSIFSTMFTVEFSHAAIIYISE